MRQDIDMKVACVFVEEFKEYTTETGDKLFADLADCASFMHTEAAEYILHIPPEEQVPDARYTCLPSYILDFMQQAQKEGYNYVCIYA